MLFDCRASASSLFFMKSTYFLSSHSKSTHSKADLSLETVTSDGEIGVGVVSLYDADLTSDFLCFF